MDARASRALQRLPGTLNVLTAGSRQTGNDGPSNGCGDCLHGGKVAFGCDGEARLDYVNAKAVKLVRQPQLFLHVHAASGRLLAIAKSGVEYRNAGSFHDQTLLLVSML